MDPRFQHSIFRAQRDLNAWNEINENSNLADPLRIMSKEADYFLRIAQLDLENSNIAYTNPYSARYWYKYPMTGVVASEFNQGHVLKGNGQTLRVVTNVRDFKNAPPTHYVRDATTDVWLNGVDLSSLDNETVLDAQYVVNLKAANDIIAQDAVIFLVDATASLPVRYIIFYEDSSTRTISTGRTVQSYDTIGSDEKIIPEEDFTYETAKPVSVFGKRPKILDLLNSTPTEQIRRNVGLVETGGLPTPGALTGSMYYQTSVTYVDEDFSTDLADWGQGDNNDSTGYDNWEISGGRMFYQDDISSNVISYVYALEPINAVTGQAIDITFKLDGGNLSDASPAGNNLPWVEVYLCTDTPDGSGISAPSALNIAITNNNANGYRGEDVTRDSNKFYCTSNSELEYDITFTPEEDGTCYLCFKLSKGITSLSFNTNYYLDDVQCESTTAGDPATITINSNEFTFATYMRPGAGKTEEGHCWVDSDSLVHIKFEDTELTAYVPEDGLSRVVTTLKEGTLKLYVNGVHKDTDLYTPSEAIEITPINQWGADDGIIGATEVWIAAWNDTEVLFDYEHPGISVEYAPGSKLTIEKCQNRWTLQEQGGVVLYDQRNTTNLDLTAYTHTWTTDADLPSYKHYNYHKVGTGLKAYCAAIPGIFDETMTIELSFESVTTGTLLQLYGDANNYITLGVSSTGAQLDLTDCQSGTVNSLAVSIEPEAKCYVKYHKDGSDIFLDVNAGEDTDTDTLSGNDYTDTDAQVFFGRNQANNVNINDSGIVYFAAIATGVNKTSDQTLNDSKRPLSVFNHQWFNDTYNDALANLSNESYPLTVGASVSYRYLPSLNNMPTGMYTMPYLEDDTLYPVFPDNVSAIEYEYDDVINPKGFFLSRYGHGYRQDRAAFESEVRILSQEQESGELLYRQKSATKFEIEDPRVLNGTSCTITTRGTKQLDSISWDSSAAYNDTVVDANMYELTTDMIQVRGPNNKLVSATPSVFKISATTYRIIIPAVNAGTCSINVSYTAEVEISKTATRTEGSAALLTLDSSDYSAFVSRKHLQTQSITITDPTYSAPSKSLLNVFVNNIFAKALCQVHTGNATPYLKLTQDPEGSHQIMPLQNSGTANAIWIRYFYDHVLVLYTDSTLHAYSARDGEEHWMYALTPGLPSGYTPKQFFLTPDNHIILLIGNGTSYQTRWLSPEYHYAMVYTEQDPDTPANLRMSVYTRYKYDNVTLQTEQSPTQYPGYELYNEGPEGV
jgi:hypothetical protein